MQSRGMQHADYPQAESNRHITLRRGAHYPLCYAGEVHCGCYVGFNCDTTSCSDILCDIATKFYCILTGIWRTLWHTLSKMSGTLYKQEAPDVFSSGAKGKKAKEDCLEKPADCCCDPQSVECRIG